MNPFSLKMCTCTCYFIMDVKIDMFRKVLIKTFHLIPHTTIFVGNVAPLRGNPPLHSTPNQVYPFGFMYQIFNSAVNFINEKDENCFRFKETLSCTRSKVASTVRKKAAVGQTKFFEHAIKIP